MSLKIAEVIVTKVGNDARSGYIVFTDRTGLQFYCAGQRTLESGAVAFGGFVSPVRPDKDARTDAEYYVNFYENTNADSDAVLNVRITKVRKVGGENKFDETYYASGVMYATGTPGLLRGMLFMNEEALTPEGEMNTPVNRAPAAKPPRKGSKKQQQQARPAAPAAEGEVDYDDIPF